MKEQKGMGHLMLIISIAVILVIVVGIVYMAKQKYGDVKLETLRTDMLLIQGKVKVMSQESVVQKNEELLKGKKVSENQENEYVKKMLENNVIAEDAKLEEYYILEKQDLEEIGLEDLKLKDACYIVNYETDEIIYTDGFNINGTMYYKLSDLK